MFALLLSLCATAQTTLEEGKYCIGTSDGGCPSGYTFVSTSDLSEIKLNGKVSFYVTDSNNNPITISNSLTAGEIISIEGPSVDVDFHIKLNGGVKAVLNELSLKNIKLTLSGKVSTVSKLTIDGEVDINKIIETNNLIINSLVAFRKELVIRIVNGILTSSSLTFTNDQSGVTFCSIGKKRITFTREGSSFGISVRSKHTTSISCTINQNNGNLTILRYGNPKVSEIFKITINAVGGILQFADQTWQNTMTWLDDAFAEWINLQNFINVERNGDCEIHLSGRDIPICIKNCIKKALKILLDSNIVSIQGSFELGTSEDAIVAGSVEGEIEFSLGLIKGDFKLNVDSSIAISALEGFIQNIVGTVTTLIKSIVAKLETVVQKVLALASDAILSVQISVKDSIDKIKNGVIEVTEDFQMPKWGNASFIIDGNEITKTVDFRPLKNWITQPITVFCSNTDFDCTRWEVSIESSEDLPKLETYCETRDNKKCLYVQLSQLPDWLPEKYCFSTAENCPEGYAKFTPQEIQSTLKGIHEKTKQIVFDVIEGMADGVSIKLGDIATYEASVKFETTENNHPRLNLNVDASVGDNVASLDINGFTLNFDAQGQGSEVSLSIPEIDFEDCNFADAMKDIQFTFTNNNVTIDLQTYKQIAKKKFHNLKMKFKEAVSKIKFAAKEWIATVGEAAQAVQETITDEILDGEFTASIGAGASVTVDVDADAKGVSLTIEPTVGANPFPIYFGTFSASASLENGIKITADHNIEINDLPGGRSLHLGGTADVTVSVKDGTSLSLEGVTEVAGDRKLTLKGATELAVKNLTFSATAKDGFQVLNENNEKIIAYVEGINVAGGVEGKADQIGLRAFLSMLAGAKLRIGDLKFGAGAGAGAEVSANRKALEDSANQELILKYQFTEDGFPCVTLDKIEGSPSKIRVIYSADDETHSKTEFGEWIQYPKNIILGNFDKATCDAWTKNVQFESEVSGYNPNMVAFCDTDADDNEDTNYVAMQIMLQPTTGVDDNDKDGLSAGAIAGIVIACVVVVALIAFSVYWFAIRKKKVCNESSSSSSSSSSSKKKA